MTPLWTAASTRWRNLPDLEARRTVALEPVQMAIDAAEARQARPLREIALANAAGQPAPPTALSRLAEIEQQIEPLRTLRAQIQAATTAEQLTAITWPTESAP